MEPRYSTKHAVLKLAYGCYPSFRSSHQKNPYYRSLMKICQHGPEICNKKCSFEVSIELLLLILICNRMVVFTLYFHWEQILLLYLNTKLKYICCLSNVTHIFIQSSFTITYINVTVDII